ncbi:MAG: CsbD family protein [Chlamydiales bacterium]
MATRDQLKGNWNIVKGYIKEQWGQFNDDDITQIDGKKDQLVGKLQKKYGIAKEEAERQVKEFEDKFDL